MRPLLIFLDRWGNEPRPKPRARPASLMRWGGSTSNKLEFEAIWARLEFLGGGLGLNKKHWTVSLSHSKSSLPIPLSRSGLSLWAFPNKVGNPAIYTTNAGPILRSRPHYKSLPVQKYIGKNILFANIKLWSQKLESLNFLREYHLEFCISRKITVIGF